MISLYAVTAMLAASTPDVLAPAWSGQVQCYSPDEARRRCSSIGAYRRTPDGKILNDATVGIGKSPNVVMTTVAEAVVKEAGICGLIRQSDVEGSTFTVDGAPATAPQTDVLKRQMTVAMQTFFGREVCVSPTGEARVDGVRMPQMDQPVIWVPKDGGYQVRMP